jgi:hypothetical protein
VIGIPASTADAVAGFDAQPRHRRTPSYAIRLELVIEAADSVTAALILLSSLDPGLGRIVELVVDDAIDPALTR